MVARARRLPHVLLLTPRIPYPALNGGEQRIHSLLRCLSDRYRFSLLTFLEPSAKAKGLAAAMSLEQGSLRKVHLVARKKQRSSPGLKSLPPYARECRSLELAARLRSLIVEEAIDLVHLEFNEMAQYASEVRGRVPVVLTEHDTSLFSPERSFLRQTKGWRDARSAWDWERQRRYERAVLGHCDRAVVVSEADRGGLEPFTSSDRVVAIPTGVDTARFPEYGSQSRRRDALVYVGHYPHYPNEDAAVFFCREILPKIRRRVPAARLRLVGSMPTARVRALKSRSVEVVGAVPEVQPYLAGAQVFVAPIRLGHGIKGKLLEAFATGTPVVSTPQACEGIPQARHLEHLLIAEHPEDFARAVVRLLRERALGRRLARNARALVEKSYRWSRQADRLDRLYRSLLRPAR